MRCSRISRRGWKNAASGAQDAAAVIAAASEELQRIAETASGGSARVELGA